MEYENELSDIIYDTQKFISHLEESAENNDIQDALACVRSHINDLKYQLLDITKQAILDDKILDNFLYGEIFHQDYDYDDSDDYNEDFKIYFKLFDLDVEQKLPHFYKFNTNTELLMDNYLNLFKSWAHSIGYFGFYFYEEVYKERYNKLISYLNSKHEYSEFYPKVKETFKELNVELGKNYATEGLHCLKTEGSCYSLTEFEERLCVAKQLAPNEKEVMEFENMLLRVKIDELKFKLDEYQEDQIDSNYRPLCNIAQDIIEDWDNINEYAKPYINAMLSLEPNEENYGQDSAASIISYFLANSTSYITSKSDKYKDELRNLLKIYRTKQ